jgi:hypothetical protein
LLKRGLSVRRELTYTVFIAMLLLNLIGCGGMFGKGATKEVPDKRQNLAKAVDMIRAGQEREARKLLQLVIDDSGEVGVTDEALFRLAILKLNDGEPGTGKSSIALLEKLQSSYPASVWTRQSATLQSYLLGILNIRNREKEIISLREKEINSLRGKEINSLREKEINSLREKNQSLSRDVRELRQTIERLKALDLELEHK